VHPCLRKCKINRFAQITNALKYMTNTGYNKLLFNSQPFVYQSPFLVSIFLLVNQLLKQNKRKPTKNTETKLTKRITTMTLHIVSRKKKTLLFTEYYLQHNIYLSKTRAIIPT